MPDQFLIGFTGYKRSGKDTAALALMRYRGYERVAFADPLKDLAKYVHDYLNPAGPCLWDLPKEEARLWYGAIGSGARTILGESIWLEIAFKRIQSLHNAGVPTAITDVRYPNEEQWIHAHGGWVWRIECDGVEFDPNDPAEQHIDQLEIDAVIWNEKTSVDRLHGRVLDRYDAETSDGDPGQEVPGVRETVGRTHGATIVGARE